MSDPIEPTEPTRAMSAGDPVPAPPPADPPLPPPPPPTAPDAEAGDGSPTERTRSLPAEDLLDPARTLDHPSGDDSSILPTRTQAASASARPGLDSGRPDISGGWGTISHDGKLEPGQVVFGRYLVKKELGRGGMGTVWLVRHVTLDADRALKLIVANIAFDPQARGRFKREAQAMARFTHPNAVTVHDAMLTNDIAFIEMELVPGKSLAEIFQRGTPMPLDLVGRILRQLCDVLQVAHDHGIIHRDLKPSNLMLLDGRPEGREFLKVLDFGIAKILGVDDPGADVHTMTNAFMGTPPYTSPEQANGTAEPRSDIYSVGAILYEFLTGFRPFSGSPAKQISDTLHTPPPPFRKVNPTVDLPGEIEALVLRCLDKDPAGRPQSPRELADLFDQALPESLRAGAAPAAAPLPAATAPPPRRRMPMALTAGIGVVALGLGGAIAAALLGGRGTSVTTPPPEVPTTPTTTSTTGTAQPPAPLVLPAGFTAVAAEEGGDASDAPPVLVFRDGPRFRFIPGGSFAMGAFGPRDQPALDGHAETLPSFYLAETEVTNGEFRRYLEDRGAAPPAAWESKYQALVEAVGTAEADTHPAVGIDHDTARTYAAWLGGRLPSSAEWEYAAQSAGRPDHRYIWGMTPDTVLQDSHANLDNIDRAGAKTAPVRAYNQDRTAQAIFDLTGNVREWCDDRSPGPPPRPGEPQSFVVRGGSWRSNADLFSTSAHDDVPGTEQLQDLGFRVALDVPETLLARLPK